MRCAQGTQRDRARRGDLGDGTAAALRRHLGVREVCKTGRAAVHRIGHTI